MKDSIERLIETSSIESTKSIDSRIESKTDPFLLLQLD